MYNNRLSTTIRIMSREEPLQLKLEVKNLIENISLNERESIETYPYYGSKQFKKNGKTENENQRYY